MAITLEGRSLGIPLAVARGMGVVALASSLMGSGSGVLRCLLPRGLCAGSRTSHKSGESTILSQTTVTGLNRQKHHIYLYGKVTNHHGHPWTLVFLSLILMLSKYSFLLDFTKHNRLITNENTLHNQHGTPKFRKHAFPLYGSGGRNLRTAAQNDFIRALSILLTSKMVGFDIVTSTPSGISA